MQLTKEKISFLLYLLFGATCWLLIWQKAILIPMTHDEVGTATYYGMMPVMDILSYVDPVPNNHILNTLLLKLSMSVFGVHPWSIRLPNVLSFLLYYVFAVKFAQHFLKDRLLQYVAVLLLVLNPYFFDFFSLARGYAMSVAFLMASLFYFFSYVRLGKTKDLWWTLLLAFLSVVANFTLLNYYVPLVLFIGVASILKNFRTNKAALAKELGMVLLSTSLLAAISYLPITKMIATKQFIYWGSIGFYNDTLKHLLQCSRYNVPYFDWPTDMMYLIAACIISFLIVLVVLLNTTWKKWNIPLISFLLLFVIGMYNVLQHNLLDVPFLNARTALFLLPLSIIPILFALERLKAANKPIGLVLIIFLGVLPVQHFIRAYHKESSFEWYLDENTYQVLDKLQELAEKENLPKPLVLNCNWLFHPSLSFHTKYDYPGLINLVPYHKEIQPDQGATFYYAQPEDMDQLKGKYDVVWAINGGHRFLLRLKK